MRAIAAPLIIAGALGLTADQRAILINADILACGLASAYYNGLGAQGEAERQLSDAARAAEH